MATYVIGDVQGCGETLRRLLARLDLNLTYDRVWFAGDIVNRGPDSVGALRQVIALGDAAVSVLGNHEIHLLAASEGLRRAKRADTLESILQAPDSAELLEWVATRPLMHREGRYVMVHAGLLPDWTVDRAEELARECEARIRERDLKAPLKLSGSRAAMRWKESLRGDLRHAVALAALTRLRCLDGRAASYSYTGAPADAPPPLVPWFDAPERRSADHTVIFGHWAALGLVSRPDVIALDTGCVWGGRLTAVRLEDRAIFQEPLADEV